MSATGCTARAAGFAAAAAAVVLLGQNGAVQGRTGAPGAAGQGFSFHTAVELINVTATVTDERGRFVPGLKASDFTIFEDGVPQTIQQFDAERVPVSLGIAIDTSGSMYGEKMAAAQAALNRFLYDLLTDEDEVFLYRFDGHPTLVRDWTTDRRGVAAALGAIRPTGTTALYDTVAVAVPLAQSGSRRKKALVVISDGNDTASRTHPAALGQLIRGTEVLVYAIGIDASDGTDYSSGSHGTKTMPVPSPFPGGPSRPAAPAHSSTSSSASSSTDRINAAALRGITDDTGGRTEIIVSPRDLGPATAGIADELSRQYFLGYSSASPKDGRWHTIEVRLTHPGTYTVRARKGFMAN